MLPTEQALLSELKLRSTWQAFSELNRRDGLVRSQEAKILLRCLDMLHQKNGTHSITRSDLNRAIDSISGEKAGPTKKAAEYLGEPLKEEASLEALWNLVANNKLATNIEQVLRSSEQGRLDPDTIRSVLDDWKELDRLSTTRISRTVLRPVHTVSRTVEKQSERLSTGLHSALDKDLGGGLRRGELAIIVAPSKHGKTANLLRVAAHLAGLGKRVVYLSFEIYLEQIVERLTTLCGGKTKIPKTLYAQWLPGRETSVKDALQIIEQVKDVDCVMVDYIELMKLNYQDMVNAVGEALLELRDAAKKRNMIVWTASQADEPQEYLPQQRRDGIYGSRRKIHHADLILSTVYLTRRRLATLSVWGSRHCQMGLSYQLEADYVKMQFREL